MGTIEKKLRTGDIVTFSVNRVIPKDTNIWGKIAGKDKEDVETDLSMIAIDIYGVFYLLKCDEDKTTLVPFCHIANEVKHVIRNWNFDTMVKNELIGEAVIGIHTASTYPNSIYQVIAKNKTNIPSRLILELHKILGINIPIDTDEIGEVFFMNKVLNFDAGFYLVDLGV